MYRKMTTKKKIIVFTLLLSIGILVGFPFIWMIFSSFKQSHEFYVQKPKLLPAIFQFSNYTKLFTKFNFGRYYFNSAFVTFVQVVVNSAITLTAGYGFAKFKFKGRDFLFFMVLGTTMIPWVATIIPLYIYMSKFGLIDTYIGLMIPGLADAFSIFLARNFLKGIPDSLIESARIDGASEWKIFKTIIIPLSKPLIALVSITKLVSSWNAFQWPLLAVNSQKLQTLPLAMSRLSSQFYDSYDLKMAGAVVTVIPIIIIYVIFQDYFVEGISVTGMKE